MCNDSAAPEGDGAPVFSVEPSSNLFDSGLSSAAFAQLRGEGALLDCGHNIGDDWKQGHEHVKNWRAIQPWYLPVDENYAKLRIQIQVRLRPWRVAGDYEFSFRAIPLQGHFEGPGVDNHHLAHADAVRIGLGGDDHPMLVRPGDVTEDSQCVVSAGVGVRSRIRFEGSNNFADRKRDLLGPFGEYRFQIGRARREGEIGFVGSSLKNLAGGEAGLIEGVPEVINSCGSSKSDGCRESSGELDLNVYKAGLRIELLAMEIKVWRKVGVENRFDVVDVFPSRLQE